MYAQENHKKNLYNHLNFILRQNILSCLMTSMTIFVLA